MDTGSDMNVTIKNLKEVVKLSKKDRSQLFKLNSERAYNSRELTKYELIYQIVFLRDAPKKGSDMNKETSACEETRKALIKLHHETYAELATQNEILEYEVANCWLSKWVWFRWGQNLISRYLSWKTKRQYEKYYLLYRRKQILSEL